MIDRRTMLAAAAVAAAGLPAFAVAGSPAFAAAASPARPPRPADPRFPQGFLWGVATAAHQVEGNNVNSDVWAMEQARPTVYAEPSGDAANSFALWPVDLDLVKGMGLNTYRFSLEWARIEPASGQFSVAMLDHYKAMIDGCRERGLHAMVTFNHFTTPAWFAALGGWSNPDAPALFARYCERAARHLAAGISHATTLNEPNLSGLLDVVLPGDIGPRLLMADKAMQEAAARDHAVARFLPGNPLYVADPEVVQAHLLAGHRLGRAAIKAVRTDLPVGVSLAVIDDQSAGPGSLRDEMRARLYQPWLEAARDAGVMLDLAAIGRMPNTFNAQRLLFWAGLEERQSRVMSALMRAYWREGRDIGDAATLGDIAAEAGMDRALVARLLASDADRDTVAAAEAHARERGIKAVPTFIIANQYVVEGAQTTEFWLKVIDDLAS